MLCVAKNLYASEIKLARKYTFKLLCRQTQMKLSLDCHRDTSSFFRHHYGYCVAVLRNAHCGTVAQSEFLRNIYAVAHWQNTSRSPDTFL